MRSLVLIFCLLFVVMYSYAQCPSQEPLRVVSLEHTDSRCENSGTVSAVVAGGTAPYIYTLTISGTSINSTDGNFSALAPGSYQLKITDQCNEELTRNIIIRRTYDPMQLTATTISPDCPGTSTGSIEITVTSGRSPFTYSLIEPSEVTRVPQSNGLFSDLPAGNYTLRVEDSCGNFQTRTTTISNDNNFRVSLPGNRLKWKSCNNYRFDFTINADERANAAPYTAQLTLPDGNILTQQIANTGAATNAAFDFTYSHIYGNTARFILKVINGCGIEKTSSAEIPFNMQASSKPRSCGRGYDYVFDEFRDNAPGSTYQLRCNTVVYTLISPSGEELATQTNNSRFNGFPPGAGYQVKREDCCGNTDVLSFNWENTSPMTLSATVSPADKVGAAVINLSTNTGIPGSLIIFSGPASIKFADGSVFNYKYPDTIPDISFESSGVARAGYFAAGNYHIKFRDTCNNQASTLLNISAVNPLHLKRLTFDADMIAGCINNNKIWYKGTTNVSPDQLRINGPLTRTISLSQNYEDTIKNLPAGFYRLYYVFNPNSRPTHKLNSHSDVDFDVIIKDLLILPYRSPEFNAQAAVSTCGGLQNFAVLPNYEAGIQPFEFSITAGPATSSPQESPAFVNMPDGLYTVRMSDACGNSHSSQLSIKEMSLPTLTVIDGTCIDNTFLITTNNPESPYYSYSWEHPDGSTTFDKNLFLDPFTTASAGTYKFTINCFIENCYSSKDTTFTLTGCGTLPVRFLDFAVSRKADHHLLRWKVAELEPNQYFVIQKSIDGRNFNNPGIITPLAGKDEFQYADPGKSEQKQWYRIAIMQDNQVVTYSKILGTTGTQGDLLIYPNPVLNGQVFIQCPRLRSTAIITIHDIAGKLLQQEAVAAGTQIMNLNVQKLPRGSYQLSFTTKETQYHRRLVIQ